MHPTRKNEQTNLPDSGIFLLDSAIKHGSMKTHTPKRRKESTTPQSPSRPSQLHSPMPPQRNNTQNQATRRWLGALLIIGLTLSLLTAPGNAEAKQSKRANTGTSEPAKKKGVTKVTHQRSSSEETSAERDRRMYRECKGMHNAGACRGYTR